MTLPPLRVGSALIGSRRYPAIVGKVKGRAREIFVCGVHIDRFLPRIPDAELRDMKRIRIDVERGRKL
jgi:hypothetical protein